MNIDFYIASTPVGAVVARIALTTEEDGVDQDGLLAVECEPPQTLIARGDLDIGTDASTGGTRFFDALSNVIRQRVQERVAAMAGNAVAHNSSPAMIFLIFICFPNAWIPVCRPRSKNLPAQTSKTMRLGDSHPKALAYRKTDQPLTGRRGYGSRLA